MIGSIQLPPKPIRAGITIKKIIIMAWYVIRTLYNPIHPISAVAFISSSRIRNLKAVPLKEALKLK